jgi:hypothetical protein
VVVVALPSLKDAFNRGEKIAIPALGASISRKFVISLPYVFVSTTAEAMRAIRNGGVQVLAHPRRADFPLKSISLLLSWCFANSLDKFCTELSRRNVCL